MSTEKEFDYRSVALALIRAFAVVYAHTYVRMMLAASVIAAPRDCF